MAAAPPLPLTEDRGRRLRPVSVILEALDLVKRYPLEGGSVEAVRNVSLAVGRGEFVAIMGSSGSGKTTLLHLLGGLDRPTSGEVVLDGVAISRLDEEQATLVRRSKTGFVFQYFNLLPILTVGENVALPFVIAGDPADARDARVRAVLDLVGLRAKVDLRPDQLVRQPALLLADEPTGNLDYTTGAEILGLLWDSSERLGQTIVLVTHDARAAAYADRVLVLRDGAILDEIRLGRRRDHVPTPLIERLAALGL
jgi:putative ABC transport system ATP-binding protein